MKDLWKSKITIYSNITDNDSSKRTFKRFVVDKCNIQSQLTERNNGTVNNILGIQTVITKRVENFVKPEDYIKFGDSIKYGQKKYGTFKYGQKNYTVKNGDFIVFAKVDDIVTNASEFAELQKKYKNNGMKVVTVNPCINGMSADNITLTNA